MKPSSASPTPDNFNAPVLRPWSNVRWMIGGLLFASTVVNYIDRQTLSVLAPYIKTEYQWTNTDFALLIISFRAAYSIGQTIAGRFLDRIGTRTGLSITVAFYSLAAMATSLATGLKSFCGFRFALGLGEAANWPGATTAVSEWFPRKESGWAVALFDSGSSVGAAIAPALVLWAYHAFNSWRVVFLITGTLGFVWLVFFRLLYRSPETHPRLGAEERALILGDREAHEGTAVSTTLPYKTLLRLPQTWGIMVSKMFTDPVWFFITDWFAIYLVSKGFSLESSVFVFWIPFVAADIGNFAGGGISSSLIKRGWSVGAARKWVIVVGGLGMPLLIPAIFINNIWGLAACFAASTLSYAAVSTMILNLPADVFPRHSVASVSGLGGTAAGIGTIVATFLVGLSADAGSFVPVLTAASLVPLLAVIATLLLVRNTRATDDGVLNRI